LHVGEAPALIHAQRKMIKMIRIQAAAKPGGITIAIDGQLIGEYVAEIEASIGKSREQHKAVDLFLRNVSHIDEEGHALLIRLAAQGVELRAAGLYSSHIVAQLQLASISRPSPEK
jgi:ABC-type transporter Mla MlaB component